jgi:hypothetical protein
VEAFRKRFGSANRAGMLDWPPVAMLRGGIALYDPIERRRDILPLAISTTRRARGLCDLPQSWPPVLRIR